MECGALGTLVWFWSPETPCKGGLWIGVGGSRHSHCSADIPITLAESQGGKCQIVDRLALVRPRAPNPWWGAAFPAESGVLFRPHCNSSQEWALIWRICCVSLETLTFQRLHGCLRRIWGSPHGNCVSRTYDRAHYTIRLPHVSTSQRPSRGIL